MQKLYGFDYVALAERLNAHQAATGQKTLTVEAIKAATLSLVNYQEWTPDQLATYLLQVPQILWDQKQIQLDVSQWAAHLGDKEGPIYIQHNNTHALVAKNILGVINHPKLADAGIKLDAQAYAKAALKQPSLFPRSPDTIANNILGVINHPNLAEADIALDAQAYAKAALKQPQLFAQSPDTIAEHILQINHIKQIHNVEFDLASKTPPQLLCLASDNLELRVWASALHYITHSQAMNDTKEKLRGRIADGFEKDSYSDIAVKLRAKTMKQSDVSALMTGKIKLTEPQLKSLQLLAA